MAGDSSITKVLSVRLPTYLYEEIAVMAQKNSATLRKRVNISDVIRVLLDEALNGHPSARRPNHRKAQ
jgi:hypothetical protein